jgi:hypothetical protein
LLQLCLALPKLHAALNQLITLTHFLPLVLVLLGISARLWTVSCALYSYLDAVWEKEGRFGEKKALRRLQAGGVEEEAGEAWKKRSKRELAEEQMRKGRGGFMAREIVELEKGKNNEGRRLPVHFHFHFLWLLRTHLWLFRPLKHPPHPPRRPNTAKSSLEFVLAPNRSPPLPLPPFLSCW